MFRLVEIVENRNLRSHQLLELLNGIFHPEYMARDAKLNKRGLPFHEVIEQKIWAENIFQANLPKHDDGKLFYITNSTNAYGKLNYVGHVCIDHIWPEFFKTFPNGKILLIEVSEEWRSNIFQGERRLAKLMDYAPGDPIASPQEMSGLQAENFPMNILPLVASGIYPLVLLDFIWAMPELIVLYIPDRALINSQMKVTDNYSNILWRLHHVFDDQWTFDGSRGPKSAANVDELNPTTNIPYIRWICERINNRMADVLAISDPLRREQLCMTFTRAVCDCVLSVTSQLPYMSKVFFFACLDKLCNLSVQIGLAKTEGDAWQTLTDSSFLTNEFEIFLKELPSSAGEYLSGLVKWSVMNMKADGITPEILRDIRNSHHGYDLRKETVARLYTGSGELHNDITLLVTPMVLYILRQKWN